MKTKSILLAVALICIALLGYAFYLQHGRDMLPCPLCIVQRYAFAAIALICLIFVFLPKSVARVGAGLASIAGISGAVVAGRHLWIKANPTMTCGIDPLETSLNTIPTAVWFPSLFKADGLCTADYDPIFGLSIPAWAMLWFVVLSLVLLWVAFFRREPEQRYFG